MGKFGGIRQDQSQKVAASMNKNESRPKIKKITIKMQICHSLCLLVNFEEKHHFFKFGGHIVMEI